MLSAYIGNDQPSEAELQKLRSCLAESSGEKREFHGRLYEPLSDQQSLYQRHNYVSFHTQKHMLTGRMMLLRLNFFMIFLPSIVVCQPLQALNI